MGFFNGMTPQGQGALNQAINTSGMLGGEASGIGANLTPFLTQEMLHPQGIGQTGLAAETAAAEAGAGGAASGLTGAADQRAAASRNAGGYTAALDQAAREREKAAAGSSEGITAQNEMLKQNQTQEGAAGLGKLYNTDTSGMLNAMGQEANDIKVGQTGGIMGDIGAGLGVAGKLFGGLSGFAPSNPILQGLGKL